MMRSWLQSGGVKIAAVFLGAGAITFVACAVISDYIPVKKISYPGPRSLLAEVSTSTPKLIVIHIPTPDPLKGVYLTSWAAGNQKYRKEIFDLVDNTEINAVVIDVKDYTGRISFLVEDPKLKAFGSEQERIPDIKKYIDELHQKGVYVIARISSFQDSFLINSHPEWAVKTLDGKVWADYKGVKWLDAGAKPVWDYLTLIGKEAYSVGFDELNFDYIRYPSDGNMKDISYSWSNGRSREVVMRSFFSYLHDQFGSTSIPISADLFGLTTSAVDDLGIGQNLADALPYFDYVSPMVYPSHFAKGFMGFAKPAEHPYEVISYAMSHAIDKSIMASSSPAKIRPWLQDFDLGAEYTPAMVRAQIQATNDSGLSSWLLWNAASVYNKEALIPKGELQFVGSNSTKKILGTTTPVVLGTSTKAR